MSDRSRWEPTGAWGKMAQPNVSDASPMGTGVNVKFLEAATLATLIVRSGQTNLLASILQDHLGCKPPQPGRVAFGRDVDLVWSALGQWLLISKTDPTRADAPTLTSAAAVTDQSDSRALVRVSGSRAREALAKGFAIDLHPSVFSTGSTAVTKVAHLSVQIWQTDTAPTFLIAVPRSFSGSFRSWLEDACAP